ncbi:MAG TPA: hypothetical protein VGJ70_25380, partial [Solirubrobacteraceae bacterium]
ATSRSRTRSRRSCPTRRASSGATTGRSRARAPLRAAAGRSVLVRLRLGSRTLAKLRAARRLAADVHPARGRLTLVAPRR